METFFIPEKPFISEKISSMYKLLAQPTDERVCPRCGDSDNVCKNGTFWRYHPEKHWKIKVQKYLCKKCKKSYSIPPFSIPRLYRLTLEGLLLLLMLFETTTISLLASIFDCARSTINRRYSRWRGVIENSLEIESISWGSFIFSVSRILFPRFYPS